MTRMEAVEAKGTFKVSKPLGFLERVLRPETHAPLEASGLLDRMRVPGTNLLRPRMVICETLNVCNADCVFCPYSKQTRPRGMMSMELLRKVLRDYESMGGGYFSLTPMVGDFLLDHQLAERLAALRDHKYSVFPSVTTNLYALDRHADDVVAALLDQFCRLHISIYGITAEECQALTRRGHFPRLLVNLRRLAQLCEASARMCEIKLTFRLTRDRSHQELEEFLQTNCGRVFPYDVSIQYANWGNTMGGRLPGDARYAPAQENRAPCALLAVAMQVYWDGRVSACACCDYDTCQDLYLGDAKAQSLLDIFNSEASRRIWQQHESGNLPGICRKCTFFYPLRALHPGHPIPNKITDFIGG